MADPFDLELQNQDIQRRREIAASLAQQSMTPRQGQMVSGHYVGPGWGGVLAPILQAGIAKYISNKADTDQKLYGQEYSKQLSEGLDRYMKTAFGQEAKPGQAPIDMQLAPDAPAQTFPVGQGNEQPMFGAQAAVPADPKRAIAEAMASRIPELKALGAAGAKGLIPAAPTKPTQHVIDGQIVETTPGSGAAPRVLGDFAKKPDQYSEPYSIPGGQGRESILVRKNLATGKVEPIDTGVKVSTTVNAGDKGATEFEKAVGKQKAELLPKSYETAMSAKKGLEAMAAAGQDLEAGIKSGAAANINLALSKWGKVLGLPDDPTIANTEAYRANMARETMQLVKALGSGTGISNADREFAEKASGGLITLDDQAMLRLLDVAQAAAGNVMLEHKRLLNRSAGSSGGNAEDLAVFDVPMNFYGTPGMDYDDKLQKFVVKPRPGSKVTPQRRTSDMIPSGTSAQPMSLDDYLKSRGAR